MDVAKRRELIRDWQEFKAGHHGQKKDFCKDRGIKLAYLDAALRSERAARNRNARAHK